MIHSGIYFRRIPVLQGTDNFSIFPQQSEIRGCLRHSTFGFHVLSAMPARFSRRDCRWFCEPDWAPILSLRLSSYPSRPVASRCFHPFRLPAFRFLSSATARFFSIDITPSRLSIAGTEKFRATQQFVRFFYRLLSYFRYSKPVRLSPLPLYYASPLPLSFFILIFTEDSEGQRDDASKNFVITSRKENGERGKLFSRWSIISENIRVAMQSIRKRSFRSKILFMPKHIYITAAADIYGRIKIRSHIKSPNINLSLQLGHICFKYWNLEYDIYRFKSQYDSKC